jgi:hypothetical protein
LSCACVKSDNNVKTDSSPSDIALTLYNGLTSGDVKAVTENIYFKEQLDYNVFRDYFQMAVSNADYKERTKNFTPNYKVTSEQIDGNEATVMLEGIGPLGNMLKITVKLLLIDGRWKVDGNHGVFY